LERGFDATTVDDVAARAGVSRRTFFRYFPSKESAFFADQRRRLEAFDARTDALCARRGAWDAVRTALLDVATSYTVDPAVALAWRRVMRSSPTLVAADLALDATWEDHIRARLVA